MAILVKVGGGSSKKEKQGVPQLPAMTSNTTPSGYTVSASSNIPDASLYPFKAFDGFGNTTWGSAVNASAPHWLSITTPKAFVAKAIKITNGTSGGGVYEPKDCVLHGANEDGVWHEITSFTNPTNVAQASYIHYFENDRAYSSYRLGINTVYPSSSSYYIQIAEIQLYDDDPRTFLYKDGVQNVEWDTPPNKYYLGYHNPVQFNNTDINMGGDSVLSTKNKVDVTDYSKLKTVVNGVVYSHDISKFSGLVNIVYVKQISPNGLPVQLSTSDDGDMSVGFIAGSNASLLSGASDYSIGRIWLEK